MPRIVEIIGPSGSGKSSIYNSLKEKWSSDDPWVTYDHVKYSHVSPAERMIRRFQKAIRSFNPFLKREIPKTEMIPEWKVIDHRNQTFLGDDYAGAKSVLMDLVEKHAKSAYDGSDKRFNTIYMLMWSIAQIDTLKRMKEDDRFCILRQGEGLISRVMHLNSPTFDENALITYLDAVPLPDVLFVLQLDPVEIVNRIKKRDRMSTLHKGMDGQELFRYTQSTYNLLQRAAGFAENHGVHVYRVDVSDPVENSVERISDALVNLAASGKAAR